MILEVAILDVRPGAHAAFQAAFADAAPLIAATLGYCGHDLQRCVETPGRYLQLARWETLEARTVGFRNSPRHPEWPSRLHRCYEPFPMVEHYEQVFAWPSTTFYLAARGCGDEAIAIQSWPRGRRTAPMLARRKSHPRPKEPRWPK